MFSNVLLLISISQGLKWGRVARVGDPAPFDFSLSITGLLFTLV